MGIGAVTRRVEGAGVGFGVFRFSYGPISICRVDKLSVVVKAFSGGIVSAKTVLNVFCLSPSISTVGSTTPSPLMPK